MVPQGLFYHFPDKGTVNCIQIFASFPHLPSPQQEHMKHLWVACFSMINILSVLRMKLNNRMGIFCNECRLPTLGSNIIDIKLEGGEDVGGNSSKNIKPSGCTQGLNPQIWK